MSELSSLWSGDFGDAYTERNVTSPYGQAASRVAHWSRMIGKARGIRSAFEVGTNIGANLDALRVLLPEADLSGVEVNAKAHSIVQQRHPAVQLGTAQSIGDLGPFDIVFTSGVLIHISPDDLAAVYDAMARLSRCYVLVAEYYNPTPVVVPYRGQGAALFKRDFAGEIMDRCGLHLVDYGFHYRRDNLWPGDDLTWFLLEKAR